MVLNGIGKELVCTRSLASCNWLIVTLPEVQIFQSHLGLAVLAFCWNGGWIYKTFIEVFFTNLKTGMLCVCLRRFFSLFGILVKSTGRIHLSERRFLQYRTFGYSRYPCCQRVFHCSGGVFTTEQVVIFFFCGCQWFIHRWDNWCRTSCNVSCLKVVQQPAS